MADNDSKQMFKHYRIDALIGQGGMGTVYKAYDTKLERDVALKLMHAHIASQSEYRERLRSEAQITAQLDHPSIIKVYEFNEDDDGNMYIAMEYIRDGSLRDHIQRVRNTNKELDILMVLQIGIQIAEALQHAHNMGAVHRDVKPGNIILKRIRQPDEHGFANFRAILTDFGLVHLDNSSGRLTATGTTIGTPNYMSPEQCDTHAVTHATDIYSLGVVLYEALSGEPPFRFENLADAIRTHLKKRKPSPLTLHRKEKWIPFLDKILARTFAKHPSNRQSSAQEVADNLRALYQAILSEDNSTKRNQIATTSTHAQIPSSVMSMDVIESVPEVPEEDQYELKVQTRGRSELKRYPLKKSEYRIGRAHASDLLLPAPEISTLHAKLWYTGKHWMIESFTTDGNILVEDKILRNNYPIRLMPNTEIVMGPYTLTLADAEEDELLDSAPTPIDIPERIDLFALTDTQSVIPGETVEYEFEVTNRTSSSIRARLEIEDLPANWISYPQGSVKLSPNDTEKFSIRIHPQQEADWTPGEYPFFAKLNVQGQDASAERKELAVEILPFHSFVATLTPEHAVISSETPYAVQLTNTGNVVSDFSITASDNDQAFTIQGQTGRLRVNPGETKNIELLVDWVSAPYFSSQGFDVPFRVDIRDRIGNSQVLHTEGAYRPGCFAKYFWQVLAFLLALLLAIVAIVGVVRLLNQLNDSPDPDPVTPSVITVTKTPAPTSSIDPLRDSDNDGLTDEDEKTITGSNPTNNDTDGDRILDGDEVEFGSDPNLADTDGDGLSDWEELQLGTKPYEVDTDNDGISDAEDSRPLEVDEPVIDVATVVVTATALPTLPADETIVTATVISVTEDPAIIVPSDEADQPTIAPSLVPATATPIVATETIIPEVTLTAVPVEIITATEVIETAEGTPTSTVVVATATGTPTVATPSATPTLVVPATITPTLVVPATITPTLVVPATITPTLVVPATVTPTIAVPATITPTISVTVTPTVAIPSVTITPTLLPTDVITVTVEPVTTTISTNTPPITSTEAVGSYPVLSCASPQSDGTAKMVENWNFETVPFVENPNRTMQYAIEQIGQKLYVAVRVNQSSSNQANSVRIYLDSNQNQGDPDSADWSFRTDLAGNRTGLIGQGDNTDELYWMDAIGMGEWSATTDQSDSGWVVKFEIDVPETIPDLGDLFGIYIEISTVDGDRASWPSGGDENDMTTWTILASNEQCSEVE